MSNRRVFIVSEIVDGVATVEGVAGEEFETEVYQPYGFAANPEGEFGGSILHEINGDPNNHIATLPRSPRGADKGTVLIHYGDETDIILSNGCIEIKVGLGRFKLTPTEVTTNMNIVTTGDIEARSVSASLDVTAGTKSLRSHVHPTPSGLSGTPE